MKWKSEPGTDISGFLDRDTAVKGDVSFSETLRIDGKLEGSIRSGKTLVVGETADVNAEIDVGCLYVSGRLRGAARATERIELSRTARVFADLTAGILVVEEGAVFEGRCSMQKERAAPARVVERLHDLKEVRSSK